MEFLNATSMDAFTKESLGIYARLLAPFAPHLAEECWELLGHGPSVAKESWPDYDPALLKQDAVDVVIQVNGKKRGVVSVSVSMGEDEVKAAVTEALAGTAYALSGSERVIMVYQPGTKVPRLLNVVK